MQLRRKSITIATAHFAYVMEHHFLGLWLLVACECTALHSENVQSTFSECICFELIKLLSLLPSVFQKNVSLITQAAPQPEVPTSHIAIDILESEQRERDEDMAARADYIRRLEVRERVVELLDMVRIMASWPCATYTRYKP